MTIHRTFIQAAPALSALGLISLAFACSSGEVDLGDGIVTQDFRQPSRCAESAVIEGDVRIANQAELESLAGCEVVTGSLLIEIFADADLSPLESLREVGQQLGIGVYPATPAASPEEEQALLALQDTGYVPSLQSLSSLERVSTLSLESVQVADLTELESLVALRTLNGFNLANLKNLAGLEGVSLEELVLMDTPALENLDGLLMFDTVDSILVQSAPNLTNIDPLTSVDFVNSLLMLSDTGLTTLPEWPISGVSQLFIEGNLELTSIDGIAGIVGLVELFLTGSPKLRTWPQFTGLMDLDYLTVVGTGIEEISLDFPAFAPQALGVRDRTVVLSAPLVDIGFNPQLTRIENPAGFASIQNLSIYENESLTLIDFGTLTDSDLLIIDSNAALSNISAPSLATVDQLVVTNNPQLDPSALDDVQTFSREVTQNAAP
jgi:hypothetical protein